jgi:hypothetical protein
MWTAARDDELMKLWPTASASEIATKLGTTRNAVIGRVCRLEGRYADKIAAIQRQQRDETKKRCEAIEAKEAVIIEKMRQNIARGVRRDDAILQARQSGARLQTIGDAVGLTRQRVQQIVA